MKHLKRLLKGLLGFAILAVFGGVMTLAGRYPVIIVPIICLGFAYLIGAAIEDIQDPTKG